jgi:hypothetical protein
MIEYKWKYGLILLFLINNEFEAVAFIQNT